MNLLKLVPKTLLLFFTTAFSSQLSAQTLDTNLWGTNGTVNAIHTDQTDNTIYIGGTFNHIYPHTSSVGLVDRTTGIADSSFPAVVSTVNVAVSDNNGGWYIGGFFTNIEGTGINRLAHINSDNTLDLTWNPNVDGAVYTMILSGNTLYIGGVFNKIGEDDRNLIGAIDITTGLATAWNPNASGAISPIVETLLLDGSLIYVGGEFDNIGGEDRSNIAAISTTTGLATSWNPDANQNVKALAKSGDMIYAGGDFITIGGQSRSRLAELDASTGLATTWNPSPNTSVYTIAIDNGIVYIGGDFTSIGSDNRQYLGAIDATTGNTTSWDPVVAHGSFISGTIRIKDIKISNDIVYVAGLFSKIGSIERVGVAAINKTSGIATSFIADGVLGKQIERLAISDTDLLVCGFKSNAGGRTLGALAEIDPTTGIPTDWNPVVAGTTVNAIASTESTLYIGGLFTSVGGQTRTNLAAIDRTSGAVNAWNPGGTNARIHTMVLSTDEETLYIGGEFTTVNATARNYIAAVSTSTGNLLSWAPEADDFVQALLLDGGTIYAGGNFTVMNSLPRNRLAAIDGSTAAVSTWDPNVGGTSAIYSIIIDGNDMYVGGDFSSIGGQSIDNIAQIDRATGAVNDWGLDFVNNSKIYSLVLNDNILYAGGSFATSGGEVRAHVAAINTDATLTAWNPDVSHSVTAVGSLGDKIYMGGTFLNVNDDTNRHQFAAVSTTVSEPCTTYDETANAAICSGDTYSFGTQTLSIAGDYMEVFQSVADCDSTVTLTLTVNTTYEEMANVSICDGDSYSFGTQTLSTAGDYIEVFQSVASCDSTVTVTLTLNTPDATVTKTGLELKANSEGLTYQWLDCDENNAQISGATSQTYTPSKSGNYSVQITEGDCSITSECTNVDVFVLNAPKNNISLRVYPNPLTNSEFLTVSFGQLQSKFMISLVDIRGKTLQQAGFENAEVGRLRISELPPAIYFIKVINSNRLSLFKVIKD
ncbi:MAG: T9SS type A sorting domain-containing protein [Reichenbachiella sp.]|uniref:T9SS type A sorting domain-containing protein n=1 Tax=Reichenbachiella sp. TaxID=2184521 RepID=UPI003265A8C2